MDNNVVDMERYRTLRTLKLSDEGPAWLRRMAHLTVDMDDEGGRRIIAVLSRIDEGATP